MAKKKATARPKSRYSTVFWMIITAISGGGVGGHFNPDWPIVGPLVQQLYALASSGQLDDATNLRDLAEVFREQATGTGGDLSSLQRSPPGNVPPQNANGYANPGYPPNTQLASARRPVDKLLIATFNIQVFGESKMSKPEVVAILADIVRQFDIVAIQEIRAQSDDIMPRFVAAVNGDGSQYHYIVGPRLGRTSSTEQYAYIYDTARVEYNPQQVGTLSDPNDRLHREPHVARFRARTQLPERAFTFWMVNTHTDPDEVAEEVDALADVFKLMQMASPDEDDVILLGDLNASETQMGRLGQVPGIGWVVSGGVTTNTRETKAYDNIVFHRQATTEFTGRWGVLNFKQAYGLTDQQALMVSDHYPVWAEFHVWETPPMNRMSQTPPMLQR